MPDSLQDMQARLDEVKRRIAQLKGAPVREAEIRARLALSEARLRAAWHSVTH